MLEELVRFVRSLSDPEIDNSGYIFPDISWKTNFLVQLLQYAT